MIKSKLNKKGFTLVELIIVIAVMAILAAIVVPRMSGVTTSFKVNADAQVCETIAREIEVGIQAGNTYTNGEVASSIVGTSKIQSIASGAEFYLYQSGSNVVVYVATSAIATPVMTMFDDATSANDFSGPFALRTGGTKIE